MTGDEWNKSLTKYRDDNKAVTKYRHDNETVTKYSEPDIEDDRKKKEDIINLLEYELKKLRKEQITDIWAELPTRIGRYVKIQLIKYTLNNYKL